MRADKIGCVEKPIALDHFSCDAEKLPVADVGSVTEFVGEDAQEGVAALRRQWPRQAHDLVELDIAERERL